MCNGGCGVRTGGATGGATGAKGSAGADGAVAGTVCCINKLRTRSSWPGVRFARSLLKVAREDSERLDREVASTGATAGGSPGSETAATGGTAGIGGGTAVGGTEAGGTERVWSVGFSVVTRPLLRTKIPQKIGLSRWAGIVTLSNSCRYSGIGCSGSSGAM